MNHVSSKLGRSITWEASKQAYFTGQLMVDRGLKDDFTRAYAYLRWVDDVVDDTARSKAEGISFIDRQTYLVDTLYLGGHPADLAAEEEMIATLIGKDRSQYSQLQSFIRNMMAIIEFDAHRKGKLVSERELDWYTDRVANSVTDGLQHFVGHGYRYPVGADRLLAAKACHISHLLRDLIPDVAQGFINVPVEYLEAHGIDPSDVTTPQFQDWVRERVIAARAYFEAGKRYIDRMQILRAKVVANWYCARFEGVLDAIEREGFVLRASYADQRKLSALLKMVWLGMSLSFRHVSLQRMRTFRP